MKSEKIVAILILLFLFAASILVANEQSVRIHPDERYLRFSEKKEPLTVQDLISLAFAASGTEEGREPFYRKQLEELLNSGKRDLSGITDPYLLGEETLQYIHKTILSRYDENQSSLEVLLENGRYNCVSSAVLYLIFTRHLGLNAAGVATVDHTFCVVETDTGEIDVETTTIYGFEPGKKKEFSSAFGETGFSYVPPGNYRSRWKVGDRKMISYILQNRISLHEKKKQYHLAVELAVDRYALVKDEQTKTDMVREFVNYAALVNEQGLYGDGLDFLKTVREAYGNSQEYREVSSVLVNNQVVELTRQNAYEEALVFIDGIKDSDAADEKVLTRLLRMIMEKKMIMVIKNQPFEAAITEIEKSLENGRIDMNQYREYMVYLYGKRGEEIAGQKNWLEAAAFIEEGLEKLGKDSRLAEAKKAFQHNFAAEKHNEFARLFNSGDQNGALRLLEDALSQMPDSDLLRKDYNQIKENQ